MKNSSKGHDLKPQATVIVILGATGDLTQRKLIPGLYNLYLDKWIPDNFAVIGVSHSKMTDAQFRKEMLEGVDKFSRRGKAADRMTSTQLTIPSLSQ